MREPGSRKRDQQRAEHPAARDHARLRCLGLVGCFFGLGLGLGLAILTTTVVRPTLPARSLTVALIV